MAWRSTGELGPWFCLGYLVFLFRLMPSCGLFISADGPRAALAGCGV